MVWISGYLRVDSRTGSVRAVPGRFDDHDLYRICRASAGDEVWMPIRLDGRRTNWLAVTARRVGARRLNSDAAMLSDTAPSAGILHRDLHLRGYQNATAWDVNAPCPDDMWESTRPYRAAAYA